MNFAGRLRGVRANGPHEPGQIMAEDLHELSVRGAGAPGAVRVSCCLLCIYMPALDRSLRGCTPRYTEAAVKSKYDPPTLGRKDEVRFDAS